MFDFRHYIDLITEAQHDALVDAIIRQFPNQEKEIRDHATWASQVLKKADRINWYLGKLRAYLSDQLTPEVLGDYQFTTMQQLQHDLAHFYGYNSPTINAYQFQRQPIGALIRDLEQLETKWKEKQNQERGVDPQEGDYVLFEFPGGIKWWWINRAYCPEEGRSGRHCGNVTGQHKTDQRILSLRNARNQVILTFILEPDGTLGEMKAKGNQKPDERYHPHIMKLLLWDKITGISGMGYLPDMNFSVFDLNEEQINYLDYHKPKLIVDQINVTPFDILSVSDSIKQKYKEIVIKREPLINDVLFNSSLENWTNLINKHKNMLIYLPVEFHQSFPNFEEQLINVISSDSTNLLKCPAKIRKDPIFLEKLLNVNPYVLQYITPNTRNYHHLCKISIAKTGITLENVPEELRTPELCELAVNVNKKAIQYVPPKVLNYYKLCKIAVSYYGYFLSLIPEKLRIGELCDIAVSNDGLSLRYVPSKLRTEELCELAISKDARSIQYVPIKLRTEKLCKLAVSAIPGTIKYVPTDLKKYDEILDDTVSTNGKALIFIPEEFRTFNRSKVAVFNNGDALKAVPLKFRTPEICEVAINNGHFVLKYVPKELRTPAICKIAIDKNPFQLRDVPAPFRTVEMCKSVITKEPGLLDSVPTALKTVEMCKFAFKKYASSRNTPPILLLRTVPNKILPEMIKFVFDYNVTGKEILQSLDDKQTTPEIFKLIVNYDRRALSAVPHYLRAEIESEIDNTLNQKESLYRILTLTKTLLNT